MSSIQSLQLQGIRSFSPKDPERITFDSPVTILVGKNGAGKTTVIEALKYITSGDMPAGSKGAAFVHDPKIDGVSEVKGQIKLKVITAKNDEVVLTRSLLVAQKRTKTEFKTLEGVVQIKPAKGAPVSMSGKCVDIEREAVLALGVSKPILNNVIFCHQEDSNWPLSEAKSLKTRFDDIFNATAYIKGIECMKALQKTQNAEMSNLKENLKFYKEDKEEAERIQKDLKDVEIKVQSGETLIGSLNKKMKPMEQQMYDLMEQDKQYNVLKSELNTKEFQQKSILDNIKTLEAKITKLYDGSLDQLRHELENFQSTCDVKKQERSEVENDKVTNEKKVNRENERRHQLMIEKSQFETELKTNEIRQKDRNNLMIKLAEDLHIKGLKLDSKLDNEAMEKISLGVKSKEQSLSEIKAELKTEESKMDTEIQGAIGEESRLSENVKLRMDRLRESQREIRNMKNELQAIDSSRLKLNEMDARVEHLEDTLQRAVGKFDEEKMKVEIYELNSQKKGLDTELRKIQDEMFEAQKTAELRSEIENANQELGSKVKKSDDLIDSYRHDLDDRLNTKDPYELRNEVEKLLNKTKSKYRTLDQKVREMHNDLSKNEEARSSYKLQLSKKENELKEYEEHIFKMTSGDEENFEKVLETMRTDLESLRFNKGLIEGSEFIYADYIKSLNKKQCCPLCRRNFEQESDVKALLTQIDRTLNNIPGEKDRLSEDILGKEKNLKQMHQLQPTVSLANKLKQMEIPTMKRDLEKLVKKYKTLRTELNECDHELSKLKEEQTLWEKILPDMVLVESLQQDIDRLSKKVSSLKRQLESSSKFGLGAEMGIKTADELRKEYETLQSKLKLLEAELERKQETFALQRDRIQKIRAELNDLGKKKLDIERGAQKAASLQENVQKMTLEMEEGEKQIQTLKNEVEPLKKRLDELKRNKKRMQIEKENEIADLSSKLESFNAKKRDIESINRQLSDFLRRDVIGQLESIDRKMTNADRVLEELNQHLKSFNTRLSEITIDLEMQETYRRNLSDNLEIKMKTTDLTTVKRDMDHCKAKIEKLEQAGSGLDAVSLRNEYTKLTKKFSEAQGRLNEQKCLVEKYSGQLKQDKYRLAGQMFKEKLIDLVATRVAVEDLKKFEKAFEGCLMAYHQEKMNEINDSIRRLWEKIYRGQDIDYIKVCAETAEMGDRRRAYNYRVVQVTNCVELDMRGRCSAGQKVLASIVIRVALAEVFCAQCGILTLDEPTTNLDAHNVQSLATAICELIEERSEQRNFQLILITHDEEFVGQLARRHSMQNVYRVTKDPNGFSRLKRCDPAVFFSQD